MKIEKQVCTIEQAKRLNELGVIQGLSLFYYNIPLNIIEYNPVPRPGFLDARFCVSAFTVSEMAAMFAPLMNGKNPIEIPDTIVKDDTELSEMINPVFMAACVIWSIESQHTTAEECNARLAA